MHQIMVILRTKQEFQGKPFSLKSVQQPTAHKSSTVTSQLIKYTKTSLILQKETRISRKATVIQKEPVSLSLSTQWLAQA